tara:strand:+ start:213 stop:503 length:291 start_codon:yes stop_codon:yes gene_type:complete
MVLPPPLVHATFTFVFKNAVPLVGCLDRQCGFDRPANRIDFLTKMDWVRRRYVNAMLQTVSLPGDIDKGIPGLKDGKKEAFNTRPRWFRLTKWFSQ